MKHTDESNETKRGGQPGNQNARTHGFYSQTLTQEQQEILGRAAGLRNLDAEIAVLRLKILSILTNEPDNHSAMLRAASMLTRMLKSNAAFKAEPQPQEPWVLQFVLEKGLPKLRTTSTGPRGTKNKPFSEDAGSTGQPDVTGLAGKRSDGEESAVQKLAQPPVSHQNQPLARREINDSIGPWQY